MRKWHPRLELWELCSSHAGGDLMDLTAEPPLSEDGDR